MIRALVFALAAVSTGAFRAAAPVRTRAAAAAAAVDPFSTISSTLLSVEKTQLLSKVAKFGLLTKLEKAGLKLRDIEPLLIEAEKQGLIGALGEINDDLLPLLPVVVNLAPAGLPLASAALSTPPPVFFALALASLGGAYAVTSLPDDTVTAVALQTFVALPLAFVFPVVFGGLGVATGKLAK